MIAQKFNEWAVQLINTYGADIFTESKLNDVWIEFHDLPDLYATQISRWSFSEFSPGRPCTPEWLIKQSIRAKEYGRTQALKNSPEPRTDPVPDALDKHCRELGYKDRADFLARLSRGTRTPK